jgi:chorismate-pyruvate lyase
MDSSLLPRPAPASRPPEPQAATNRRAPGDIVGDPIDRMLLTSDGTVTTMLEACTGEPIVTALTRQSGPASLPVLQTEIGCWWQPPTRLLDPAPGESLIARRVILEGARSGVAFVAAESLVVPERLPEPGAQRLRHAGASLGRVLNASGLATRRHIVEIVEVRDAAVNDRLGVGSDATLARRTYTISSTERTVAAVTEWLVPGRLAMHRATSGHVTTAATGSAVPRADRLMFLVDL